MDIWAYPVTFPFGATTAPYSPANPHKGEDRAAPTGTLVPVNGVEIGRSGRTGIGVTGPHLHVHRYGKSGVVVSPRGGGKILGSDAVVTQVQTKNTGYNGKFVKVRSNGEDWLYLHLDSVKVKVGQKLAGEKGMDRDTIVLINREYEGPDPSPARVKLWLGKNPKDFMLALRKEKGFVRKSTMIKQIEDLKKGSNTETIWNKVKAAFNKK